MTLGEYILIRMDEEDVKPDELDVDTIDFFYQQWLVDPERAERYDPYR